MQYDDSVGSLNKPQSSSASSRTEGVLRNSPLLITWSKGTNAFGLIEYSDMHYPRERKIGPAYRRRFFAGGQWAVMESHGRYLISPY